jgi:hypothetical protein
MHKALIAYTEEMDDVDFAVEELMKQLDLSSLLSNSAGIVFCDPGFYFSGVYKALKAKLDFPLLGATTITAATSDSQVSQILALMILTGDDVQFSISVSDPLKSGDNSIVEKAYADAKKGMDGDPAVIMTYFPLISEYDCDEMIDCLSGIAPGIPIYGSLTSSPGTDSFTDARVLYDDEGYDDRMSLLLIYGNIKPRFFLDSFPEEKHLKDKGVITSSKLNRIITVNDIPAKDYLVKLGISADEAGNLLFPELFPLILDYHDGTPPYTRAMLTSLEDGSILTNGGVREGATLSVGSIDVSDLLVSVDKTMNTMKANKAESDFGLAIFHSCAARYFVAFGYDTEIEIKGIKKHLTGGSEVPYIFCYSGGEICPVVSKDGTFTNRVNTYSLVACVF